MRGSQMSWLLAASGLLAAMFKLSFEASSTRPKHRRPGPTGLFVSRPMSQKWASPTGTAWH